MAGTVVQTNAKCHTMRKLTLAWTSTSGGAATCDTTHVSGHIHRFCAIPSTSAIPTSNYDVVLNDSDGLDILMGLGANLKATSNANIVPILTNGTAGNSALVAVEGVLSLAVSSAGNVKSGQIILYYQ